MKNRDLINAINGIHALRQREAGRGTKTIIGQPLLILSRNLRTLEKEYSENYVKDLQEIWEKYCDPVEEEITIPADEERNIEEHTEKRIINYTPKEGMKEIYEKEMNNLLELEIDVKIMKVRLDLLESVADAQDADALEFMVDYDFGATTISMNC